MGDSDSKKFGDNFVDKLEGQLDRKPPLFNKSLFAGAGDATRNAWGAATGNANDIIASGGLTPEQRAALGTFGDVNAGYGAAAERARAALMPVGARYGAAVAGSDAMLSPVYAGYGDVAANGGLTAEQRAALDGTAGLGARYAGLADAYGNDAPGFSRLRSKVADDTLTDVASLFASNGRYGSDVMAEGASEGLADALAGLDYANFQNDVNNRYRSLDAERGVFGDTFAMSQAGTGNRLAGLSGQAGTAASIFGNRMAGAGGEADIAGQIFGTDAAALAGRQNAASAQFAGGQQGLDNRTAAIDALTAIGAARDANRQGKLLGDADLYDRTRNAQLDWLQKIGGIAGPTATAEQPNWWEQILGSLAGTAGRAIGNLVP